MKRIEVCLLCNHRVGDKGEAKELVDVTTQLAFQAQKVLKVTVCYKCFVNRYHDFQDTLEQRVKALKSALVVPEDY